MLTQNITPCQKILQFILYLIVLTFPFTMNIALISNVDSSHPVLALNVSIADGLLGLALVIWIIQIIWRKRFKDLIIQPVPVILFLIIAGLSFIHAFSIANWAKEFVQLIEFFLLFYLLLLNNKHLVTQKEIINLLLIVTSLVLLSAGYQYFIQDGSPYLIRGLFENRNIMGLFMGMIVPIAYGLLIYSSNLWKKIWMIFIIVLSFIVILSGSAILSIIISLATISFLAGKKVLLRFALGIVLSSGLYIGLMPEKSIKAMKEFASIYEQGDINENYYRRLTILDNLKKTVLVHKEVGDGHLLKVQSNLFMHSKMPELQKGNRYSQLVHERHIKNRYIEMQAALKATSNHLFSGVGLGNYQSNIGKYFGTLPKVNTAEPNQHNGYLILSTTMGILGLAAFVYLLIFYGSSAWKKFDISSNSYDRGIYIGLLGSIVSCAINNFFCQLLVASLMVPLIVIFFLLTPKKNEDE